MPAALVLRITGKLAPPPPRGGAVQHIPDLQYTAAHRAGGNSSRGCARWIRKTRGRTKGLGAPASVDGRKNGTRDGNDCDNSGDDDADGRAVATRVWHARHHH